ncbi:MAG: nucleoside triphosphate pyrophosphatase [Pseudomonadota bacterium]
MDLYLASQSPRRRELLEQIGVRFSVVTINVKEHHAPGESPRSYVQRLSLQKATAGAQQHSDKPVLGADTIVVLGGQVMEKPRTQEQAVDMLMRLSDCTHQVMTSVSVCTPTRAESRLNISQVTFRPIASSEAIAYSQTGEPQDKAGAYGIQGLGALFVKEIRGSYSSVVGLPLLETSALLKIFEVPTGIEIS